MTAETADTTASVNGSAPAAEAPCEDCATKGELGLAILAGVFGVFVIAMAFDIGSGGKLSGWAKDRAAPGE